MSSNPVFGRIDQNIRKGGYAGFGTGPAAPRPGAAGYAGPTMSPGDLQQMYDRPSAGPLDTRRLTLDDVLIKTLSLFAIVLAVGAASWWAVDIKPALALPLWLAGMFSTLVLGFVIVLRRTVHVPLILLYAALEGVFVGSISKVFENAWGGVVGQAVVATLATFAGMFIGWKVGVVKVTNRSRRIFGMAVIGYLVFALVNLGAAFLHVGDGWGFVGTQFGWVICIIGVGLAAYSLAIDFDTIDRAVAAQLPERYSWLMAHGLIVSLVWLYIEFLRLFARLRN